LVVLDNFCVVHIEDKCWCCH